MAKVWSDESCEWNCWTQDNCWDVSEGFEDARQPLESAEASGDLPVEGQGQAGGLGRGLGQQVVGVEGDRFGNWRTSLLLESATFQVAKVL